MSMGSGDGDLNVPGTSRCNVREWPIYTLARCESAGHVVVQENNQ